MRITLGLLLTFAMIDGAFAATSANDMIPNLDPDCPTARHDNVGDLAAVAQAASAEFGGKDKTPENVGAGPPDGDWQKACGKFFDSQGNMGEYGKMVSQTLDPSKHKAMFQPTKDLEMICPGFATMQNDDRKKFWVWTLSATAYKESTCKESASGKGPNGTVQGLFQLHKSKENAYPPFSGSQKCKRGDSMKANNSIECTVTMLSQYMERAQALFTTSGKTYWATYRADAAAVDKDAGTATCARVAQFPGCGQAKSKSEADGLCKKAFAAIKGGKTK